VAALASGGNPMTKDLLKDRERAFEADYFRKQDEKLIQKMRERADLQEVAQALAEKLQVDDQELLRRVIDLGLTRGTGAAILLAPLVQVAWAEGKVTARERAVVFEIAATRGVEAGSPPHQKLEEWLRVRPRDELFETAMEVMKAGLALLTAEERDERIRGIAGACQRVAEASGGGLAKLIGFDSGVSGQEAEVLDAITAKLRSDAKKPA
jgi:hypothetical protein